MRKKKSYMNNNNILSEGFFDKFFKIFKVDKSTQLKMKKDRKIKNSIKDLNNYWSNLEDYWEKEYGQKVDLGPKFKLSDFI